MKAIFKVFPGTVTGADGDRHHIGFSRLCQLYGVPPRLCLDMSRQKSRQGIRAEVLNLLIPLGPSSSGNYGLSEDAKKKLLEALSE